MAIDIDIVAQMDSDNDVLTACAFLLKGGVGKSTTIAHTGVALANAEYDVLLIDLAGKQGDLAKQFGIDEELPDDRWPNISTVFDEDWDRVVTLIGDENVLRAPPDADFDSMVAETDEGVDLIPAHDGLDSVDQDLSNNYEGEERYTQLNEFIQKHVAPEYDVVLIDLPGVSNNVSWSGVFAAQNVLAPVQAGRLEATQIEKLERDLAFIRNEHDQDVRLRMLIPNMIDHRTKLSEKYPEQFGEEYGEEIAPKSVPRSQDIINAQDRGETIFAPEEVSDTAQRAREAYEVNALELIERIDGE